MKIKNWSQQLLIIEIYMKYLINNKIINKIVNNIKYNMMC